MTDFYKNKKEQSTKNRLLFCFISCFIGLFSSHLVAQENNQFKLEEVAIGYSIIHEKLPEGYSYTPFFFTARLPIHQFKSKRKSYFKAFAEPQFVLNNPPKSFPTTFEFGVNLGFQYVLPIAKKSTLAVALSAGPHYLSLETAIQAKGFIFSDNIEIGYYQQLGKRIGISIKPRFRHISNAGFLSPNIGIDNLFLMVGITWTAP